MDLEILEFINPNFPVWHCTLLWWYDTGVERMHFCGHLSNLSRIQYVAGWTIVRLVMDLLIKMMMTTRMMMGRWLSRTTSSPTTAASILTSSKRTPPTGSRWAALTSMAISTTVPSSTLQQVSIYRENIFSTSQVNTVMSWVSGCLSRVYCVVNLLLRQFDWNQTNCQVGSLASPGLRQIWQSVQTLDYQLTK